MNLLDLKYPWAIALCITMLPVWAQTEIIPAPAIANDRMISVSEPVHSESSTAHQSLSETELLQKPQVLALFLDQSIERGDWQGVATFLPLYEKIEHPDPVLVQFARAGLARSRGDLSQAIDQYRAIVSEHAELTPVRMHLASALFENRSYEAAAFQFEKARSDQPVAPVVATIEQYLEEIHRRQGWQFNAAVQYLSDNNINNTSKDPYVRIGSLVFKRTQDSLPQQGRGISYFVNTSRDFFVADQHAVTVGLSANGKTYWNNHTYDDLVARASVGYRWQAARQSIEVAPFYQVRRFGNEPYSNSLGLRSEWRYLFTPRWQTALAFEYASNRYDTRKHLNGNSYFSSVSVAYSPGATTTLYGGLDYFIDRTQDVSESSNRKTARLGIAQDLPWGISVQAQASAGNRIFKNAANVFNLQRRDNEYETSVTLWHRRFYIWKVIPKLTWSYNRVDSNIGLFSYTKQRILLSLDKKF